MGTRPKKKQADEVYNQRTCQTELPKDEKGKTGRLGALELAHNRTDKKPIRVYKRRCDVGKKRGTMYPNKAEYNKAYRRRLKKEGLKPGIDKI